MPPTTSRIPEAMQEGIAQCQECHSSCLALVNHCLELGGPHADPAHIGLLLDCAEICQTSANFMLRASERHQLTCRVCAEVCWACAEDCERMGAGDAPMLRCVDQCRRCAESCERMARG
jgi:hypothetical protein